MAAICSADEARSFAKEVALSGVSVSGVVAGVYLSCCGDRKRALSALIGHRGGGVEVAGARTADDRLREAQAQGDIVDVDDDASAAPPPPKKAKKVKAEKKSKSKKAAAEKKTKSKKSSGSGAGASASASAGAGGSGSNEALAACFDELCEFEGGRGFKANAYRKVANVLREAPAVASGKEAGKMAGIGKSSATKIQEFLDTGTMAKLEELRAQ